MKTFIEINKGTDYCMLLNISHIIRVYEHNNKTIITTTESITRCDGSVEHSIIECNESLEHIKNALKII